MRSLFIVAALVISTSTAFAAGKKFTLTSADVKEKGTLADAQVFNSFGCSGGNVSPQLAWTNAPEGTKSFVVTVYDPDAPTGSGWWHWVVYNIPADTKELANGAGGEKGPLPPGALAGRTDFGNSLFGGACPPAGDKPHKYIFTVYALKIEKVEVPADASPAMIGYYTKGNALGSATITATYGRKAAPAAK